MIHSPTPPAERLLGKSPEWINAYTKAYQSVTTGRRTEATLLGCITGGGILAATVYALASAIFGSTPGGD